MTAPRLALVIVLASLFVTAAHADELPAKIGDPQPEVATGRGAVFTPERERHVGLLAGAGPGNLYLDVDYGHFYGFIGTSIGYPLLFVEPNGRYFGLGLGAGGSWNLSQHWKIDLVGTLTPTWYAGFSAGIGVSVGFHYTAPNGFTASFQLPVFGVAPGCSAFFDDGDGSSYTCLKNQPDATSLVLNYFIQAGMSLPTATLGYRF